MSYYGYDTGDEIIDESCPSGDGFLAEVVREWENATIPLQNRNIRVINLRISGILQTNGGMLGTILLPFKLGLGGVLGDGNQWFSWMTMNDLLRSIVFMLKEKSISGPVNMASPKPGNPKLKFKHLFLFVI
jgi:NAD dependent epimerase/dehydratase family enzyme